MRTVGVVGAGAVGLWTGLILSRNGFDVTVVDESTPGSGSTRRAGFGVRTFFTDPVNRVLCRQSLDHYRHGTPGASVVTETGYRFHQAAGTELDAATATVERHGDRVTRDAPPDHDLFAPTSDGTFVKAHDGGVGSPDQLVDRLVAACTDRGVTFRTATVETVADTTLLCVDERMSFDHTVNAAGAWADEISRVDLPFERQCRYLATTDVTVSEPFPLTVYLDSGLYVLPGADGTVLVGGAFGTPMQADSSADLATTPPEEWVDAAERHSSERLRRSVTVTDAWGGFYAVTDSRVPYVFEENGTVYTAGFSGHGIMQAPAVGELVLRLLTDRPLPVNPSALRPSRDDRPTDIQF
jgi:Glycine/D-amino acid oxidases (deaminating)